MKGMEQIIQVRKAGFKPSAVFWDDRPNAIEGWESNEAEKRYCLEVRNYILDERFYLATDGSEPIERMDLRGLVNIEHVVIDTRSSIERARALHKAARKAGAKVVTTTFGGERCISFAAINDVEALFDDEGAKQ